MKLRNILFLLLISLSFQRCGIYSFTGGNVGDAKTIKVAYFENNAVLVEPSLSQKFTIALQDLFTSQTNLTLVNADADLTFEGEIVEYRINPMTATASQQAAQNRLTIGINVRFFNRLKEEDNFERKFSFYYDFDADANTNAILDDAFETIFERINQDIFNASVAKW